MGTTEVGERALYNDWDNGIKGVLHHEPWPSICWEDYGKLRAQFLGNLLKVE